MFNINERWIQSDSGLIEVSGFSGICNPNPLIVELSQFGSILFFVFVFVLCVSNTRNTVLLNTPCPAATKRKL